MKVHVTLGESVVADPVARRLVYYRVLAAGHLVPKNPARFAKHGIITGEMPADRLSRVLAIPGVEAADIDDEETAGSHGSPTDGTGRLSTHGAVN
jgi:hypothetical protein